MNKEKIKRDAGLVFIFLLFVASVAVIESYTHKKFESTLNFIKALYSQYLWEYNTRELKSLTRFLAETGEFAEIKVFDEFGKELAKEDGICNLHILDKILLRTHLIPRKRIKVVLNHQGIFIGTLELVYLDKNIYALAINFLFFVSLSILWLQHSTLLSTKKRLEKSIKELKKAEELLITAEKMASIGRLVANISHDINTPIGVSYTAVSHLKGLAEKLLTDYQKGELTEEDFQKNLAEILELSSIIEGNLVRVSELVKSLKRTSMERAVQEKKKINLCSHIKETLKTLEPLLKANKVKWTLRCPDEIEIETVPGALSQIITNLVENSIEHGFTQHHIDRKIEIEVKEDNQQIMLIYRDNGVGMTEEVRRRIFEPFFTTHPTGKGTGLGMNIVYNLTTTVLQGRIEVESEPGKGIQVIITIPKKHWS